jgi:hypothetical protein
MITITKEEYDTLKEDALFLRALERAGVDNWEGYDDALDILEKIKI